MNLSQTIESEIKEFMIPPIPEKFDKTKELFLYISVILFFLLLIVKY